MLTNFEGEDLKYLQVGHVFKLLGVSLLAE